MSNIKNILDGLKKRLDENNEVLVQNLGGNCYLGKCIFKEPTTNENINRFEVETGWKIPEEFREFLLIHNGAEFFLDEYGGTFGINSLDFIITEYNYAPLHENFYPIGSYVDLGQILINSKRVKEGRKDYMFLVGGIGLIDFKCDFETWLDRMIVTQGLSYWEWKSKEVFLDDLQK